MCCLFFFGGRVGGLSVSVTFMFLSCCAFLFLKFGSTFWHRDPCAEQKSGESVAVNRMFLHFQTSGTSFSADCNFLLVSLISSPNALAANSDPVCSFFSYALIHYLLWLLIHADPTVLLPCLHTHLLIYPPGVWCCKLGSLLTTGQSSCAHY